MLLLWLALVINAVLASGKPDVILSISSNLTVGINSTFNLKEMLLITPG